MAMEKQAQTKETDIKGLIKRADREEAVIVGNYSSMNEGKQTLILVATGSRATDLRELLKQAGVI
jgi:Tfp pilus assembly protein PilP